jgi:hypothetical protein
MQQIIFDPLDALAPASIARHVAMRPGFRVRCQGASAHASIQVDVAAKRPETRGILDEEGFVASLVLDARYADCVWRTSWRDR